MGMKNVRPEYRGRLNVIGLRVPPRPLEINYLLEQGPIGTVLALSSRPILGRTDKVCFVCFRLTTTISISVGINAALPQGHFVRHILRSLRYLHH